MCTLDWHLAVGVQFHRNVLVHVKPSGIWCLNCCSYCLSMEDSTAFSLNQARLTGLLLFLIGSEFKSAGRVVPPTLAGRFPQLLGWCPQKNSCSVPTLRRTHTLQNKGSTAWNGKVDLFSKEISDCKHILQSRHVFENLMKRGSC
jgi:hypothetical protein